MAETIEQKAHRLLAEGRLVVERVDPPEDLESVGDVPAARFIVASCRGFSEGEVYHLGFDPRSKSGRGEWRCTCQANAEFHRRCSHLIALQLVTRKPE